MLRPCTEMHSAHSHAPLRSCCWHTTPLTRAAQSRANPQHWAHVRSQGAHAVPTPRFQSTAVCWDHKSRHHRYLNEPSFRVLRAPLTSTHAHDLSPLCKQGHCATMPCGDLGVNGSEKCGPWHHEIPLVPMRTHTCMQPNACSQM